MTAPDPAQFAETVAPDLAVWTCRIGWVPRATLPDGSDAPMRAAVAKAFRELTGFDDLFLFSGWGGKLDETELAVIENRLPDIDKQLEEAEARLSVLRGWKAAANAQFDGQEAT